tara:strand:- start:1756 stop:3564 length:1809 start_codon:yes stop_codon:yes gene_type:complete
MNPRTKTLLQSVTGVLLAGLLAAGCSGGGGSGSGGSTSETGQVTLAVTDAATDEIDVFEIDIVGFRFQRSDGATVEVLPQTTRVDFAQLVSVSEVIAAATLPVGRYERAFMTLDFGSAMVRINGNTSSANLVDSNGAPLSGRSELEIVFAGGGFTVGARKGYFAEVDFDLDQSLLVDSAQNKVEVDSVFYASINPGNPKAARTPGLASSFSGASFSLDVRRGLGLISRGTLTVNTSSSTVYNLEGQVLTGQAGYDALKAKGDNTLVVSLGQVDPLAKTQTATLVVLLPQDLDEVGGLVVARSGGPGQDATLTLRGVAVRRGAGSVTFNDTVTLTTSFVETKISKRGQAGAALSTDAINVGQRILAYGRFTGGTLDLSQSGAGFVRLVETDVAGALNAPPSGSGINLDVTRIGRRLTTAFDTTVSGVSQGDLDALECSTGGLGLATLTSGSPVVVRGFFAPVTSTTTTAATFSADTVIDRTNAASLLRLRWIPASTAPIASSGGSGGLTLDVSSALIKSIDRGLVAPTTLTANPTLADPGQPGLYATRQGFKLTLFNSYANWKADFEARVTAGTRLQHVRALGAWDAATSTLKAQRGVAVFAP